MSVKDADDSVGKKGDPIKPSLDVYRHIKELLFIFSEKEDIDRFDALCKYILSRYVECFMPFKLCRTVIKAIWPRLHLSTS